MELRRLGRSGIKVSPMGLGMARLAGLGWREDLTPQATWQEIQDAVRQIRAAVDLGVTLFDTADNYGQGLSERILGEALRGRREGCVVVTKFGEDPMPEQEDPWALEADLVARKCEASLRRLEIEYIDLYLLHRRDYPLERAPAASPALVVALEDLVRAGKIRYYGWSTDDVERARLFARRAHFVAIEHRLNVFNDRAAMLELCQELDLASLNRVPLLMGVLAGRWSPETKLEEGDPRAGWFAHEEFLKLLGVVQQIEPYLTCDGRSHVQGAQGRLMARLHNFSVRWQPSTGLCKRKFDWDGLFQNDVGSGMANANAWALLSPSHRKAFSFVAEHVRDVMQDWGQGPDVFGLIHGDLGVDANLYFWHGEPRAIDFDDSGFGYWVYDLAVALDVCRDDPAYPCYREALLNGYAEYRSLPEKQAEQVELFLAALEVYWNLWATGGTHIYPSLRPEFEERIASTADFVVRYVRQHSSRK